MDEGVPKSNTSHEQNEKIDLRILIADDDPAIRKLLGIILGRKYSSVESVTDGQLLVDRLSAPGQNIDFVITDNNMYPMSGFEAIKKIRDIDHLKTIPIIMITTFASGHLKRKVEELGVVCLSKPINQNELLDTIEIMRSK